MAKEYSQKLGEWFKCNSDKMMISASDEISLYATNAAASRVKPANLESANVSLVADISEPSTITDIVAGTWFMAVKKSDASASGTCSILI